MGWEAELAHLFRALKMPAAARALPRLAERARREEWPYERLVQSLLETEVSARDSHGGEDRIRQARFPARKTLEEFDFTFQRSVRKTVIEHLGGLTSCTPRSRSSRWARRVPARRICRLRSGSAPAWPATASCS
jgi:DNA replication protein DnaC